MCIGRHALTGTGAAAPGVGGCVGRVGSPTEIAGLLIVCVFPTTALTGPGWFRVTGFFVGSQISVQASAKRNMNCAEREMCLRHALDLSVAILPNRMNSLGMMFTHW